MGTNKSIHREEGTDLTAVNEGYISITPLRYDLTDHGLYKKIEEWDWSDLRIFKKIHRACYSAKEHNSRFQLKIKTCSFC